MKKLLKISSVLAIVVGILLVAGGVLGICFTYKTTSQEKIVTPSDAIISSEPVRGPLTLWAQADIIRTHTLRMTAGQTYAEMPRGEERDIWITATTLITALNLGILAYAFSGLVVLLGLIFTWTGIVFCALSRVRH